MGSGLGKVKDEVFNIHPKKNTEEGKKKEYISEGRRSPVNGKRSSRCGSRRMGLWNNMSDRH